MPKIFFTSDNHFGHANIIEYCGRPFKYIDEMDDQLIKNWNSVVSPEDTVFHLGDFVFRGRIQEYMRCLNGTIIWIKGNHDSSSHCPIREMIIEHGGVEWTLIHDPAYTLANNVLCGHVHEAWKIKKIKDRVLVNVGVDVWDFKPVTIEQILKAVEKAPRMNSDGRPRHIRDDVSEFVKKR